MSLLTRIFYSRKSRKSTGKSIRLLVDSFECINKLEILTNELEKKEKQINLHEEMLRKISDNLEIAIWAKDIDNKFVYANKPCCEKILKCSENEATALTDTDFKNDALSTTCIASDNITKERMEPIRFIEHASYPHHDVWIETLKSPWIENNNLIGTVGIGKDITDSVPQYIKNRLKRPESIEIPMETELCTQVIEEILKNKKNGEQ